MRYMSMVTCLNPRLRDSLPCFNAEGGEYLLVGTFRGTSA